MNPDDTSTWDTDWMLNDHIDWSSTHVTDPHPTVPIHSWQSAVQHQWDVMTKAIADDLEMPPHKYKGGYVHDDFWKEKFKSKPVDNAKLASTLMSKVPGLHVVVEFPCDCSYGGSKNYGQVQDAIMHLNDNHHPKAKLETWTRERIADWLDTLDVILTLDNKGQVVAEGVTFWQVITPGSKHQNRFFVSKNLAIDYAHGIVGSGQRVILKECVDTIQLPIFDNKGMGGIKASRAALSALGGKHKRDAEPVPVAPKEDEAMQELMLAMTSISSDLSQAFANLGKSLAPALEQLKTLMDSELGQALLADAKKEKEIS